MNPFYFTGFYLFKTKHSNFLITWLFFAGIRASNDSNKECSEESIL